MPNVRGSTSLESFHLHLARFVPGISASAVNFQAYLLDGITTRNDAQASEAIQSSPCGLRAFDARLKDKVNVLSQSLHGRPLLPLYVPPSQYPRQLFGVE